MSKVYDRIEWSFLRQMLIALGFDSSWVELIILCVTTIEYMVTQNGHEIGHIKPGRGLRQSDPLSPYLFIICAERLSAIIQ